MSAANEETLLDHRKERVQFDKITARVSRLCYGLDAEHVDAAAITQKVISGVYQGVTTVELDNLVRLMTKCVLVWTPILNGTAGRRDRSLHDGYPSRLRDPRCAHCSLQSAQADQEAVLFCYRRPLPLRKSKKQQAVSYDLGKDI